jgi:hypothetical protein
MCPWKAMNGVAVSLARLRVKFEAASALCEHRAMIDFGVAAVESLIVV